MAFFCLTCGTHNFQSLLPGYEQIEVQCQNCGNASARVYKRWQWFTVCFIPLIPFSLKPWHEVNCHICNFKQDIKQRPDVEQQMNGGTQQMNGGAQQIPLQNQGGQLLPREGGQPEYK